MATGVELVVERDPEAAAERAAVLLAEAAAAGGGIALSGGSTPRRAYELTAQRQPDWSAAELWWADERCVPPDDELSNYRLVQETLLDHLRRLPRLVHRVAGERAPAAAAEAYDAELRRATLDLVLLGVGPDGHTASLFPDAATLDERSRLAVAASGPRAERVTLTIPALERAGRIVFLVTGDDKAEAAQRAFALEPSRETPASLVRALSGRTLAVLDEAAAARISR